MLMHALMAFVFCVVIWDQFAFDYPPEEDGPMPSAPRQAQSQHQSSESMM